MQRRRRPGSSSNGGGCRSGSYGSRCVSEMAGSDRVKCHATCQHFFQLMADDGGGGGAVGGGRVVCVSRAAAASFHIFVCVCEIHWKMVWMSLTICLNCQRIKVAVSAWQTGLEPKWRALLPLASLWLSSVPRCSFIPRVSLSPPFRLGLPFLTPVSPPLWLRHPPARPPARL